MNDKTKKVYEIDDVETMKGFLERTYEKVQELRNELSKDCDPNTDSRIRSKWRKIEKSIDDMGNVASRVWRYYEVSRDNGNDCINIDDVVGDIDVFPLVGCFRDFGVEHFTFSSTWSSAVKTAWLFKMNGCEVEGLVEVNGNTNYMTGKHEKMPAYKFAVKWGHEQ